ncbi:MAG TPA: polysaccharide deacetylase family protein [Gemmatimonadales bacterium]|nr:polysaccharide deacetylase family protein [Gemmatimonadales bacterium]
MRQGASRIALRSAYYDGLRALRLPALVRRWRDAGVVLCYHNVLPSRNAAHVGEPAVHLAIEAFTEQIGWLAHRYDVVSLGDIVQRLSSGRSLRRLAALTFDDGYDGVFTQAWPVLRQLGLPATVFIVSDRPDRQEAFWWDRPDPSATAHLPRSHRPAGWDSVRAAARDGLDIGIHTATHASVTQLDDAELEREVVASRDTVREKTGASAEFFAYPYGLWNARARDAVRTAGYRGAVTLDYGLVTGRADPWGLRRINIPAGISLPAFEAWVAGLHPRQGRR